METPNEPAFWALEKQYFWEEMHALVFDTMLQSMNGALPLLPAAVQPLVDWELANEAALQFMQSYRLTLDGITETTARQTLVAINEWIKSGNPLNVLIQELTPIYGRKRAELIASTEVTRIYAAGNMAVWQSTGVVGGKRWQTARDERVCTLCGPLHGQIVEINADFSLSPQTVAESPQMRAIMGDKWNGMAALQNAVRALRSFTGQKYPPAHARCRCWILPFVGLPLLEEQIGKILAGQFFAQVQRGEIKNVGVYDARLHQS